MQKYLVGDYETFSECDLKKSGAFEYAAHPSTEILCFAFAVGTKDDFHFPDVRLWVPPNVPRWEGFDEKKNGENFSVMLQAFLNPEICLVAHNAFFEQVITRFVFGKKHMYSKKYLQEIGPERWICTAATARATGLPGKLELLAKALGLEHQKDMEGHRLMMKLSKPRKPTKKDPSTRHSDPEDYKRLCEYGVTDVLVEIEAFLKLPPMTDSERQVWILNQTMNFRGFKVDRPLVSGALDLIAKEVKQMDSEIRRISGGVLASARQRDAVLDFLKSQGLELSDLKAGTVSDLIEDENILPTHRRILEIRQATSKSSTAKFHGFEKRTRFDGRARDNTQYHGAHTGREAGSGGIQPHNLFKTTIPQKDIETALELIRRKDFHAVGAVYEKPMQLYASVLRSCIVADEGKILDVGDFSTIEVRVLFWLAGHTKGLDAIRNGDDLYLHMASKIFKWPLAELTAAYKSGDPKAKAARQLGKTVVLGAGYGIGKAKFYATCIQQKMEMTEALAAESVSAYRQTHYPIPIFWKRIEQAALVAMKSPGKRIKLGHLIWKREKNFLTVQLPNGRKLHYFKPKIEMRKNLWGFQESISYLGLNSMTKKLERETVWGGVLVENVTQAVARDVLVDRLLAFEKTGIYRPILQVHDEIVCERLKGLGSTKEFETIMEVVPSWATGLPIKVEGWSDVRYRK